MVQYHNIAINLHVNLVLMTNVNTAFQEKALNSHVIHNINIEE